MALRCRPIVDGCVAVLRCCAANVACISSCGRVVVVDAAHLPCVAPRAVHRAIYVRSSRDRGDARIVAVCGRGAPCCRVRVCRRCDRTSHVEARVLAFICLARYRASSPQYLLVVSSWARPRGVGAYIVPVTPRCCVVASRVSWAADLALVVPMMRAAALRVVTHHFVEVLEVNIGQRPTRCFRCPATTKTYAFVGDIDPCNFGGASLCGCVCVCVCACGFV